MIMIAVVQRHGPTVAQAAIAENLAMSRACFSIARMNGARPCALAALAALTGCMQLGTGTGTGGGSGSGGSSGGAVATAVPAESAAGDAGVTGSGCTEDPASGVVLCQQISVCPNVVVEPGAFPDCGFRMYSASPVDLECLCGDALCPIGVPTRCGDVSALLDGRSEIEVCQQRNEGGCVSVAGPDAAAPGSRASSSGGSSGGAGPCEACAAQCGGTPSCYQACGC
jgi:hypothetical protein